MTHQDESANADAHLFAPSTRRSRRDGEREAELRALYADAPQASSMRVVDGGSPMYRTRRDMRESASRLARDLPVIVEPALEQPAPAEPTATAEAATAKPTPADAPASAAPAEHGAPSGRRARRLAAQAQRPVADETADAESPAAQPEAPVAQAAAPTSRRDRRIAAASVPAAIVPASEAIPEPIVVGTAPAVDAVAVDPARVDAGRALDADEQSAAHPAPSATASASTPTPTERGMTRSERRAARAASSDEVSAAVAAVLGGEQEDVASTPVRSPLRREMRAPKPATTGARRPVAHAPVVRPSRRARSSAARKAMQRLAAAGVILSIGSFVAVTSLPAQAFAPAEQTTTGAYGDVEVEQQLDVTTGGGAHGSDEVTAVLTRDDFGVDDALASARLSPEEVATLQAVADANEIGPYFGGEPAMPEVWAQLGTSYTQSPFPSLAEVPVSSGFGYRWGSFHGGVDLVPGAGTPVFPVANGVVVATWQGNNPGGGGYQVIVEHNIDGEYFQSWYPHMQAGSIQVEPGQVVDITTQLGAVGSTGRSTGAHLHLEIKNGDYVSVDPLVWLATREQILEP